jgi:acyl-CoA thioesterase FadM
VNLFLRLVWLRLTARFRSRCDLLGPVRTPFRVFPTDLDVLRHVNNGVYLSILDLARTDLVLRSGLAPLLHERGWFPVVTAESIRFQRSLTLFQRFEVETRILGWDDRSFFVDQRFFRGDQAVATALIAGRFLSHQGSVAPAEVVALAGLDPGSPPLPDWARRLADAQEELGREESDLGEPGGYPAGD